MNSTKSIEMARTPDLLGSWLALQRAAQRARLIAAQTGTAVVVERNGVLEHLYPSLASLQAMLVQGPPAADIRTAEFIQQVAGTLGDDFADDIRTEDPACNDPHKGDA